MSLPPAADREPIHRRVIDCRGYRRADGLWDIDGHLRDTKDYPFENSWRGMLEPGTPVHDMYLRLTVDDDMRIHAVEASTDAAPFRVCPEVPPRFQALVGEKIGPGWKRKSAGLIGGAAGCTHLSELLGRMATVCYQTIMPLRDRERRAARAAEAAKAEKAGGAQAGTASDPVAEGERRGRPPRLLNSCHAWRDDGPVVQEYFPEYHVDGGTGG